MIDPDVDQIVLNGEDEDPVACQALKIATGKQPV
jgi:hypothetical protein